VWNASTRTYDPVVGEEIWGEWAQVRDLTTAESLELECVAGEESIPPKPHKTRPASPQPEAKPPDVLGTEAAVPTGVEAGLASLPNTGASGHNLLAQLMVGSGLVLLVAGGWLGFGRREYGGHQL
jgi:LPXTG-motif cell wall-anchored protein